MLCEHQVIVQHVAYDVRDDILLISLHYFNYNVPIE